MIRGGAIVCAALVVSATGQAADYYVSTSGSDSSSGTQSSPFKTIAHADSVAKPGDTIHVAPGVYPPVITSQSGTSSAHIRFVSDSKYGAKVAANSSTNTIWYSKGAYVDIIGFEVDGTSLASTTMGIYLTGSYSSAQGNHVHDIQNSGACASQGAAGIEAEGYYYATNIDVIGNLVHDVGPKGCSYDHGIYVIAPYSRIENNVVYNNSCAGIHAWHDDSHETIANNTVLWNACAGVVIGGGDYYHSSGPSDYNVVANNIFYGNYAAFNESGQVGTHNLYTNNLVYDNQYLWSADLTGTQVDLISADPLFVNVSNDDFHLQSSSPAIGAANSTYSWPTDFDGVARPQAGAYDVGAYEYTGSGGQAPTATLSASGKYVVTLKWGSTNADTCTGTNFNTNGLASGSAAVVPTVTTTYTVTCSRQGQSATASTTVRRKNSGV